MIGLPLRMLNYWDTYGPCSRTAEMIRVTLERINSSLLGLVPVATSRQLLFLYLEQS